MSAPSRLPSARSGRGRPMSMYGEIPKIGDNTTSSKQAKRKSLLPQLSRKVSEETESADAETEDFVESPGSSVREETASGDTKLMPPPLKPARRTSMRLPGSSVLGRSASVRTHTRTTSKDTTATAGISSQNSTPASSHRRLNSVASNSGSTRLPPSPDKRGAPLASSRVRTSSTSTASSSAPGTAIAGKRSSIYITRPADINTSMPAGGPSPISPPPGTPPASMMSRQRPVVKTSAPSLRPAFTTYQQHFSPAKSALPKPPIPAAKHTRSESYAVSVEEADVVMTFDILKEQIELLQLSLLHQAAIETASQYEASAARKLGDRHARLLKDFNSIRGIEQDRRRQENLSAIETWCPDAALLTEHLQTLSRVVTDLRSFTEPGSRYSELTASFENWASKAADTLFGTHESASFIEALPDTWRATHTSLALKLRAAQRDFGVLPPLPATRDSEHESSLGILLETSSMLVDSMLKELEIMTKLQKEVLQRERARIDEHVNTLIRAQESERVDWAPAWQSVK